MKWNCTNSIDYGITWPLKTWDDCFTDDVISTLINQTYFLTCNASPPDIYKNVKSCSRKGQSHSKGQWTIHSWSSQWDYFLKWISRVFSFRNGYRLSRVFLFTHNKHILCWIWISCKQRLRIVASFFTKKSTVSY